MCRLIELEIDPAFRDEEEGGAPEDYSFEVEEADDGQSAPTASRTHESLSIFPQEFINNSQIAYLIIKRQLMLLIHANYCIKVRGRTCLSSPFYQFINREISMLFINSDRQHVSGPSSV